ncbi:MAG: hypothetical protein M3R51_10405 [Candidatus Eremiobacteraeota bacterium]|nr:hypothetical protein [Candidatus Eremiobacteraeota bacterium]
MKERSTALAVIPPPADFAKRAYIVGGTDGPVLSALVCIENAFRSSTFVARILNRSAEMMFGSVYGETARGLESLPPNEFRIPAQGLDDITIVARRRALRRFRRIVVTMRGATLEYSMDAPVPDWPVPIVLRLGAVACVLAAAFGIADYGSLAVGSAPPRVAAHTLVQIPYAAYGAGTLAYDVRDSAARIVSEGKLPLGRGTLQFESGSGGDAYRANLYLRQVFRIRQRTAGPTSVITPSPAPKAPAIRAFELSTNQVRSGDPIDVRYSVSASGGSIRIADVAGITLASAPLAPVGHTSITAPAVESPTPVRVELLATRDGGEVRTSSTALIVPRTVISGTESGRPVEAGDVVRLPVPYATAGRGLVVELLQHRYHVHLELQDATGRVAAQSDPAPDADDIVLDVPATASGNYVLVVTIDANGGEQSVLVPIPVRLQ